MLRKTPRIIDQEDAEIRFKNKYLTATTRLRIDFSKAKMTANYPLTIPDCYTIDVQEDIALIFMGADLRVPIALRETAGHLHTFLLCWHGVPIEVVLNGQCSGSFTADNFEVAWRIIHIGKHRNIAGALLRDALKSALLVFGYQTIRLHDKVRKVSFVDM